MLFFFHYDVFVNRRLEVTFDRGVMNQAKYKGSSSRCLAFELGGDERSVRLTKRIISLVENVVGLFQYFRRLSFFFFFLATLFLA